VLGVFVPTSCSSELAGSRMGDDDDTNTNTNTNDVNDSVFPEMCAATDLVRLAIAARPDNVLHGLTFEGAGPSAMFNGRPVTSLVLVLFCFLLVARSSSVGV
jgi:hypothetical protein